MAGAEPPAGGKPDDRGTGIGVDEWVARSRERTVGVRGRTAPVRRFLEKVPPGRRLAIAALAAATVPYLVEPGGVRIAIGILILAMLAVGLNVVVGWAGLLDLGYVAFFGFGAYFYAIVASDQLPAHWPTWVALPVIVFFSGALGVLLSLASRRLVGDYLAILTLFFSLIFVEIVTNFSRLPFVSEDFDLTGGPNGIAGVEPWDFFGFRVDSFNRHYYVVLGLLVVLVIALHNINESRTGRAWRAVRENTLAAEHMTIPVNNLMLVAFATGAAIAGFTGTVFAAVTVGVFPTSFTLFFLITIYAAVILGGAGSISGVLVGALVIGYLPELLRSPRLAGWLFYLALVVALVVLVRPWQRLVAVIGGVVVFGFVVRLVVGAAWADATTGTAAEGFVSQILDGWLIVPGAHTDVLTNIAFVAAVVGVLMVTITKGASQVAVLIPTVYLGAFVWETRLVFEPALTRQLLFGALLVLMMAVRPEGLLGKPRVEIA